MDRKHAKWLFSTAANLKMMFAVAAFFLTQPRSKVCCSVPSNPHPPPPPRVLEMES